MFMGDEFGQFIEWNHHQGLDWHLLEYEMHNKIQSFVRDLNKLYKDEKALWDLDFDQGGFEWIDCNDSDRSIISFSRKDTEGNELVFVCNFTPVVYGDYRVGVHNLGYYREVLNSDSEIYGGSNVGNNGGVIADQIGVHGKENSLKIVVPPLSVVVFKRDR